MRDTSPSSREQVWIASPAGVGVQKYLRRSPKMAAMKPRTGDGPMEVTKEARSLVMRIPLEGGGRLVVELNGEEASNLGNALHAAVQLLVKK